MRGGSCKWKLYSKWSETEGNRKGMMERDREEGVLV